jgi:cytidyltransferase-like protein
MKALGLVGGTFDRFHKGHQKLLDEGLFQCHKLEIWMTSDSLAKEKDYRIELWVERRQRILDSLSQDIHHRLSFHILTDALGPAPTHENADAIICTTETLSNCEKINSLRVKNNLEPLHIILVDHALDWMDRTITSTSIRKGTTARDGSSWLHDEIGSFKLSLNPTVESSLKTPFGELIEGDENDPTIAMRLVLDKISDAKGPIIAVGDVTVKTLQDMNRPADIALIDGMTKRVKWEQASDINKDLYDYVLRCQNPAGCITPELYDACSEALTKFGYNQDEENTESTLIIVDGEEDLAPLIIHPLAPLGAVILYGQPGRGVVIRLTDLDSKSRCRDLLESMDGDWKETLTLDE